MDLATLLTLKETDLGKVPLLCGHSPTYRCGYNAKVDWLRERMVEGMRYTLLQVDGYNAGMIEYLPAEAAWRGVQADGYLFIHCFWVVGRNRKHGYGRLMLEACLHDAGGTNGVAVMTSKSHWLPTSRIFLKNGFEQVDESHPFLLLAKRLREDAPLPRFKRESVEIPAGLTLYYSDQCPYMQNMPVNVEKAGRQLGCPVTMVHLESAVQAQASPCPYGVLAVYYNGALLDYRPIAAEKIVEMVKGG